MTGRLNAITNPTQIRLARIKKGLTQTDVAKEIGLTYATYGAIEAGRRKMKEERAKRISDLLGLNIRRAFVTLDSGKLVAAHRVKIRAKQKR